MSQWNSASFETSAAGTDGTWRRGAGTGAKSTGDTTGDTARRATVKFEVARIFGTCWEFLGGRERRRRSKERGDLNFGGGCIRRTDEGIAVEGLEGVVDSVEDFDGTAALKDINPDRTTDERG